jgi:K(+)-stimulated pyrophosphate-energized sodium pump
MPEKFKFAAPIFAFGLVAFGFLGMGPVTIAVDSYGPVTDNAQSVYELSQIESIKNVKQDIKKDFGFDADFENAKYQLEKGDGAGNTFKATAKPVLIGTAVVGATTMVFGIIILLENLFGDVIPKLSLVQPQVILGLLMGGAVIYWFTGASCQAVVTGAYRAVVYIKEHIKLDASKASVADSKEVVRICTVYAQKGMWNIFIVIFCFALALSFFNPYFFIGYLIAIAFFGLFQAIFMANAGGAWDNAKKIVEVDLRQKGTDLHAATVVGDTVGDPFKDTSSVSLNPVIKFTTLFGLLATEIAVTMKSQGLKTGIGAFFFVVALIFVYRSFYAMRIPEEDTAGTNGNLVLPHKVHREEVAVGHK